MAKQHEIAYAEQMNAEHAANKPFSDRERGAYLMRLGAVFSVLPPPPARVLDLGCGTGWTSAFLARAGYAVVGVDLAPEMIRLAELHRPPGFDDLSFRVCDYEHLDYRDEFDAALFFDALHHADDEGLAVRRAFQALRPGGVCVIDEPGLGHSQAETSRAAVDAHGVTEKDMPPARVVELGRAAGFTRFRSYIQGNALADVVYGPAVPLADPFAHIDPRWQAGRPLGLWGRLVRRLRWTLNPYPAWRMSRVDHLSLHLDQNGLVLMRKPAPGE